MAHSKKSQTNKTVKKQTALVNVILDKSGSMASKLADTIGGFNTYLKELGNEKKVTYSFSLTLFDTTISSPHVAVPLADVKPLTEANYRPDGNTALNDAVGITVRKVEADKLKVDKIITVIMTDGEENSSREWTAQAVKDLIKQKEKEGNWTFVFLGASPNAWAQGAAFGISQANTAQYDMSKSAETFSVIACATNASSSTAGTHFSNVYARVPMRKMMAANLKRNVPVSKRRY